MSKRKHRYQELFSSSNAGSDFYSKYKNEIIRTCKHEHYTLPIAAAYNAGFDEGYAKARNELCHISQTKND